MRMGSGLNGAALVSVTASAWYLGATWLAFKAAERAPLSAAARFLARHSLTIMLLHMPIFIALNPVLAARGWPYPARVAFELVICLPLLAWVSAALIAVTRPHAVTERVVQAVIARSSWRPARRLASLEPR
jgi:fucose 4-O-acetylase-like acetyltransferase